MKNKKRTNQRRAYCSMRTCGAVIPLLPREWLLGRSTDIGDRAIAEARSGRIPIRCFLLPLPS